MGGNIFKGKTQPIKKEHIAPTIKQYFEELSRVFPKKSSYFNEKYFKFVGSVGKKDYSGDIDLAVDSFIVNDNTISNHALQEWGLDSKEIMSYYEQYKKRARTASENELITRAILTGIVNKINLESDNIYCDEKKITAGNIFCYFPQYDEKDNELDYGVQIDWMLGDLEWLEFSYYSEVYEGNVKGLHRTQLILSMFDNLGLSFNHTQGVREKGEGRGTVARTPSEAVEVLEKLYNAKFSNVNNYFILQKELFTQVTAMEYSRIMDIYLKILDRTRCDIPYDLQDYWLRHKERLALTGKFLPDESNLYKKAA